MNMKKLLAVIAASLACAPALAQTDLNASESGAVIPQIRMSFNVASDPGPNGPAVPHSGHGIEIGISGGTGKDEQSLSGSDRVVFGGRTFTGTTLQHEFDFRFYEAAYRYRRFFGAGGFGIEALGGLGIAELDFTTRSPTASANEKISNGGILGGFGLLWRFQEKTSLHARLSVFASTQVEGVTAGGRMDVHMAYAFSRNVGIRGGITSWSLISGRRDVDEDNLNSRLEAGLTGLAIALDVAF
jgi:hypothetical protein